MEQTKYDVFISYSRKDYVDENKNEIPDNIITAIKNVLRQNDISYWMDEEGNLTGKKFAHIIASKIRESMTFLFVCSWNSVASRWVDRELSVADTLDKHIIPFICDDSYMDDKVIMFTSSLDRVEYFRNPQKEMEKLISTIKRDKTELENRILEEERIRQQMQKEAEEKERKEKAKKEISELVTSYKIHSVQQESIVQQLYSIHKKMGHELKQCPICDSMVLMNKSFCENCGWQFPPLYAIDAIDEDGNLTCDKKQLAQARTNWQTIGNTISLKEENNNLKGEKEKLSTECENLRNTINSLQDYIIPLQKENHEIKDINKLLESKLNEAEAKLKAEDKNKEEERKQDEIHGVFIANGVSFKMIKVESGTFMMGATKDQDSEATNGENPVHQVTLSDYYIGETQVTQELWQAVMSSNPSHFKGAKRPVENVSWDDCQKFISQLNKLTGNRFRLPTEAEWEFAARGGNKSNGCKYAGSYKIDTVAWYGGNSGNETHPVGQKQPNELGLYDMSGNVWEWCNDKYRPYSFSPQSNPQGPSSGSNRVSRGGSWSNNMSYCRVANRNNIAPLFHSNFLGFRLAL